LIDRVITVSGQGIAHPQNVRVRIGTLLSDVIDECGGFIGKPGKIIMGGPMMGISQYTLDVPIIKGTSGILIFQAQDLQEAREENCIRCGKCIDVCPMQLVPSLISVYVENRRFDLADSQGVLDCIECGCCAYVCPSKRPIIQLIKFGKSEVLSAKKNQ
jgi:electron transport complex protein RnfC